MRIPLRYHKKRDGTIFLAEISGRLCPLNGRKVICGVARDITDRKQAEGALRRSAGLLKESQEVARLGHYVFAARAGRWESSEILDTIFGIDREYKITGMSDRQERWVL